MPVELSQKRRYFSINDGLFKEKVSDTQELHFDHLSKVHLLHISFQVIRKDRNDPNSEILGDVISLHFVDSQEYFVVQTWLNSIYAKCFFHLMENVNWKEEITLIVGQKVVDGKKKGSLYIKQNGAFVKWKYTKDNPEDLPALQTYTKPDGTTGYNNEDQETFFMLKLESWLMPLLKQKPFPFPNHPHISYMNQPNGVPATANSNTPPNVDVLEDDLPF